MVGKIVDENNIIKGTSIESSKDCWCPKEQDYIFQVLVNSGNPHHFRLPESPGLLRLPV